MPKRNLPSGEHVISPLVFSRYREIGVIPGWDRERLLDLCKLANRLPVEICAMAGLYPYETRDRLAKGGFQPSVSLHFAVIEAVLKEVRFGEPWAAPMPIHLLESK